MLSTWVHRGRIHWCGRSDTDPSCNEDVWKCKLQWGLEYQTHRNPELFEVLFSNCPKSRQPPFCSVFQWSGPLENQNLASLDYFIDQHSTFSSLAKRSVFQWSRPFENRTKWRPFCQPLENKTILKTEQTPTIGIPNVFGIPAPTVFCSLEILFYYIE